MLITVNAPYGEQLDAEELAAYLSDPELAKRHPGHISTFLSVVPVALQVEFAVAQGIAPHRLAALAKSFSHWSGETYPLAN